MLTADPATLIADLGFLVRWDVPAADHDALLVVALRPVPTERHYDPELIIYWRVGEDGRCHRAELSLATSMPQRTAFSWGPIEILDRFGIGNTFISFGGTLTAETDEDGTALVSFRSSAPILRRGGHSQRYDNVAAAVAAFFGRLLVPIDFQPGAEQRIAAATPLVRYAAFLRHDAARLAASELVRDAYGPDARLVRAEAERLSRTRPDAWAAGLRLLEDLGMVPALRRA
jgi:hypothetical protein